MAQPQDLAGHLLASDENLESFKSDPEPVLKEHGIELSDEQHSNLKKFLGNHDLPALKLMLAHPALHTMVATQ